MHAAPKVSAKTVCTKAAGALFAGGLTLLPGASTLSGLAGGGVGGFPSGVMSEYGGAAGTAGSGGSGFAGGAGGAFGSGGASGFSIGPMSAGAGSLVQELIGSSSSLMLDVPGAGSPETVSLRRVEHFPQSGGTQPQTILGRPSFGAPAVEVSEPSSLLMLLPLLAFAALARKRAR